MNNLGCHLADTTQSHFSIPINCNHRQLLSYVATNKGVKENASPFLCPMNVMTTNEGVDRFSPGY